MYRLENLIFGLNPFAMKTVNLILHIFVSCGLINFYTHYLRTGNKFIPFVAASIFAVHPIHSEAVCGIVGRPDIIIAALFLIVFQIYKKYLANDINILSEQLKGYTFIFTISTSSILFKETGITIIPLVIIYDIWKFKLRRVCIFLLLTVAQIFARLWVINFESPQFNVMDNPLAANSSILTRILTQFYLYALNFWLLLCPDWLSFDWAMKSIPLLDTVNDPRNLGFLGLMLLFGSCVLFGRRYVENELLLLSSF